MKNRNMKDLVLAGALLLVPPPPAGARLSSGHQATVATCLRGSYPDGCAGAPTDGNYQNVNFFTYARQSGQAYISSHPPPWNVAGVDYPVGYSLSAAGGSLRDPATAHLPSGCAYEAKGSTLKGAIVICSTGDSPTFNGFDFSLHDCTPLEITDTVTGVLTITNSKWVNGANCSSEGYLAAAYNPSGLSAVDIEHSYFDGSALSLPASLEGAVWLAGPSFSVTLRYDAFLRCPCRPVGTSTSGNLTAEYNYWEGFTYGPHDGHGEVIIDQVSGAATQLVTRYSFNTVLQPSNVLAFGSTTMFYPVGADGATFNSVQIDHNTTVANLISNLVGTSASISEIDGRDIYRTCLYTGNYTDDTGSFFAFASVNAPACSTTFNGNINMVTGRTISSYNVR